MNDNARRSAGLRPGSTTKTIGLLSISHVVNDSYMNLFPPLIPFLMPALGLSIAAVAWLTTCFAVTSSLSQLAIGHISDRIGGRFFIVMGPLVAAIAMSSIGLIDNYWLLAMAVAVGGLGVASFHPPSSAIAGSVSTVKSGRAMSVFSVGGNLGWAVMPLLAVPLVERFGLSATPALAVPGLIAALMLYFLAPPLKPSVSGEGPSFAETVRAQPVPFASLLGTVAFRSLCFTGLITFLPKFLGDQGVPPITISFMLSILTFAGAVGGLIGGYLSDYLGRKPVIIMSLILTVGFLVMFTFSGKQVMALWLGLAGASLLASFSVTVVAAQEIFPNNKAIASSLALGFGLGLGGLGVGVLGIVAQSIGIGGTMVILSLLPLVAIVFALGLPGKGFVNAKQYSYEVEDAGLNS